MPFASYSAINELENDLIDLVKQNKDLNAKLTKIVSEIIKKKIKSFLDAQTIKNNIHDSKTNFIMSCSASSIEEAKTTTINLIRNAIPIRSDSSNTIKKIHNDLDNNCSDIVKSVEEIPTKDNSKSKLFKIKLSDKLTGLNSIKKTDKGNDRVSYGMLLIHSAFEKNKNAKKNDEKIFVSRETPRIYKNKKKELEKMGAKIRKLEYKTKINFNYKTNQLNMKVRKKDSKDQNWTPLEEAKDTDLTEFIPEYQNIIDTKPSLFID